MRNKATQEINIVFQDPSVKNLTKYKSKIYIINIYNKLYALTKVCVECWMAVKKKKKLFIPVV